MQILFFGLCFLLFNQSALFSQTTRFYSTEQGLSNSLINQIYQDKKGFIWIATENGLNKFEGTQFTVYRKSPGDDASLKSNRIHTLFEDSSGNFWVYCSGSLMKYDRRTDSFREIALFNESGSRIYPNITSVCERQNGDVWFATSAGLFSIKKGENQIMPETLFNEYIKNHHLLTVIFEDSGHRLWIETENSGMHVFSFNPLEYWNYSLSSPIEKRIGSNNISAICEGENGEVFVGTLDGGVYKIETTAMKINYIADTGGNRHLPIKTLLIDSSGQLLVGTDGFGMKKYHPQLQILEPYEPFSSPFNFASSKIHSLIQDRDGNIWAGIFQKGLFFIPANPNGFNYYGYKSFRENSIGSHCIMAVHKDKEETVWVGTDNDGLYAINEQTGQVRHYKHTDRQPSVPNTILCIYDTDDGRLWLGSYLDGLAMFDKRTGKTSYISNQTNRMLSSNKVFCITGDKKGSLWIGTYGGGLYQYDIASGTITANYYQPDRNNNELMNNWINSIICEDDGQLWLGTLGGLTLLDTRNNTFRNFKMENSQIPGDIVFALQNDRHNHLWISTGEGLVRMNKTSGTTQLFTTRDGLPSDEICAIEEDENGNIWMSTLSGISKYSPAENRFTNFYASDGLQGNEFTFRAHCKSADGELFFGGVNGVTSFYPNEIHSQKKDLNVYVTNFYLFGEKVIFDQPVMEISEINLAARDNVFTFEFSTLQYTDSEGILYRYRLENFNTGWTNTLPGTNRVTYTNLPPGKYKFFYQAIDKENMSSIHAISITIRPPWYASPLAKILYGILLLSLAYGVYAFISSRIKQKNEMLRLEHADQINEAKLQFFTNISHEIRTPMTLVIGPLKKLISGANPPELQKNYLLMYRNARRILRLINQLMDIRKIDHGQMFIKCRETDMVGFIVDIMQAFNYMAEQKNIHFTFTHEMPELKVWVDLNNFDKVLFNILSNAFKFTPEGGSIDVSLITGSESLMKHHYFEIQVRDTGIGIDESKIGRIFERFYQINSGQQGGFGTGIGLHLAHLLVDLLHGDITVRNNAGSAGTTFIVRLPMGNSHLKADELEEAPANVIVRNDDFDEKELDELPEKKEPRTKYRIALVEDNAEIRNYIRSELADIYHISVAKNGKEGLSLILKEHPDLVISDIIMDEMDGVLMCRKIKSNVDTAHIPVVLLTAKIHDEDKAEGLHVGADAYITKPFSPDMLKKTISNLLKNRERMKGKFAGVAEGKMGKIKLKPADELLMERVMKVVNEQLANPNLNVEILSSHVGISRVHMHRKLKELTNQSARDFIRTVRMKQAAKLLSEKKLSVSEVAYAVGFSSLSHFSSSFREFFGMSPREYGDRIGKEE